MSGGIVHTRNTTRNIGVAPLRKAGDDGKLYTRPPAIEAKLAELLDTPREELATRCTIRSRSDPGFIATECLLHLVRATRQDNDERWFEQLFTELVRRILRTLPRPQQETEGLVGADIREGVLGRFQELLSIDRNGYCERLDFFEVRFNSALKTLRIGVERKAFRAASRRSDLEHPETGELRADVEAAVGCHNPFEDDTDLDPAYRSRVDAAIARLPPEQREIIEMLKHGIPIESKDPDMMTIVRALGCVEKTVRNRRDRAFEILRRLMKGDEA
ncbi:MAG: DNA-binding response regulator [Sphingomicrobium sp.]